MLKKTVSLLLALLLFLPSAVRVNAADEADFVDFVTDGYDRFTASIYREKAADDAIDCMLQPALYGKGKNVVFKQNSAVTAAIFQSNLFRPFFIDAVTSGIQIMQQSGMTQLMTGGNLFWYDFILDYAVTRTQDLDYSHLDAPDYAESLDKNGPAQPISPNRCDNAMTLVVGNANCRILLEQTGVTAKETTYRIRTYILDKFDFVNGKYKDFSDAGFNTTFAKLLTTLGALLGLKDYTWHCEAEMTLTVPNTCTHDTEGLYRWQRQNDDLVSVAAPEYRTIEPEILFENPEAATEKFYRLDRPIRLLHNAQWYVEFRLDALCKLYLGPAESFFDTWEPVLIKEHSTIDAAILDYFPETDPKTGKTVIRSRRDLSGYDLSKGGISSSKPHTYRIENRLEPDGTNALWLLIDGKEMGRMNRHRYFHYKDSSNEDLEPDDLWANGKDFVIRYIFNNSYTSPKTTPVVYLEIGTGTGYHTTEETPGSCTEGTVTSTRCLLCNAVCSQNTAPAPGHNPRPVPGMEATCTEAGLTEGAVCGTCGEILKPQKDIPALGHAFEKGSCSHCGEKDSNWLPGDADGNGILSYSDALIVLRTSIGLEQCDTDLCDMDGNGLLNYSDALIILRSSIGL